jgi:hypothetical protein
MGSLKPPERAAANCRSAQAGQGSRVIGALPTVRNVSSMGAQFAERQG